MKYIPASIIQLLGHMAHQHHKNSPTDDCPSMAGNRHVPIFRAITLDTGWLRCMIPTDETCERQVCLDVPLGWYNELPEVQP